MQSIEEFMQCYFAERTQLLRAHEDGSEEIDSSLYTDSYADERMAKRELERKHENDAPPKVLSVVKRGLVSEVVTSEPDGVKRISYKYFLVSNERGWQIAKIWEGRRYPELGIEHQCENSWSMVDYCL